MSNHEHLEGKSSEQARKPLFERRFSRREVLKGAAMSGAGLAGWVMVGCGSEADESPTSTHTVEPTPTEITFSPLIEGDSLLSEANEVIEGSVWYAKGKIPEFMKKSINDAREGIPEIKGEHDGTMFIKGSDGKIYPIAAFNGLWRMSGTGLQVEKVPLTELAGDSLTLINNTTFLFPENARRVIDTNPVIGDDVAESKAPSLSEVVKKLSATQADDTNKPVQSVITYGSEVEDGSARVPFKRISFFEKGFNIPEVFEDLKTKGITGETVSNPFWTEAIVDGEKKYALFQAYENGIASQIENSNEVRFQSTGDFAVRSIVPGIAADISPEKRATEEEPENLREYLDKTGIDLGVMLSSFHTRQPQVVGEEYLRLPTENFNELACPDFVWDNPFGNPLRPDKENFDFTLPDSLISFASRNKMDVKGYHLVWGSKRELPQWLSNGNFTRDELIDILNNHIRTVVGRYRGKVKEWSVVNEPFGTWWEDGNAFWMDKIGPEYIDIAFRTAHEEDPEAVLILNDFGMEIPGSSIYSADKDLQVFNLMSDLKKRGISVNGIGFQLHVDGKDFTTVEKRNASIRALKANIEKYKNLGFDVYVTEFDMRLNGLEGNEEVKYEIQALGTSDIFKACIESGVKGFTIWGVTDKYADKYGASEGPVLFDENNKPKPAFHAISDVVKEKYKSG